MKNRSLTLFMLLVTLLLTTGCNYREYCEPYSYEELARIHYIWDEANPTVIPPTLNLEITQDTKNIGTYETPSDYYNLDLPNGSYEAFAWNNAENIKYENRVFYAELNLNGSIKSVGELYTGDTIFTLRMPSDLTEYFEKGNQHEWNTPPFHSNLSGIIYKEIPIIMRPQSFELRIEISVGDNIDLIDSVTGALDGICQSKDDNGNCLTSGWIDMTFEKEGDKLIGKYDVLGYTPGDGQNLTLDIVYKDGTTSKIEIDVTEGLSGGIGDHGSDHGGSSGSHEGEGDKTLDIQIDIKKSEVGYTATLKDWEEVESGRNEDLEIE